MLYPDVQKMTTDKINRYMLAIAAAKCARQIVDAECAQAEEEANPEQKTAERMMKELKPETVEIKAEASPESKIKPVTRAIDMLNSGECKIILDD